MFKYDGWTNDNWTDSQLFDYVQAKLGLGYFDDDGDQDYWLWRTQQVSMLKGFRKRRGVTVADMVVATDFCKARHYAPTTYSGVIAWLPEAQKWAIQEREINLERDILLAVAQEDDEEWRQKLLAAHGDRREGVLREWRQQHESSLFQ